MACRFGDSGCRSARLVAAWPLGGGGVGAFLPASAARRISPGRSAGSETPSMAAMAAARCAVGCSHVGGALRSLQPDAHGAAFSNGGLLARLERLGSGDGALL